MIRLRLLAATALVAASALPAAAQDARPMMMQIDGTILDISAEGTSTRVPDIALIQAGVMTQSPTATEAMQQNAARMSAVIAALRRAGIADRDIQTSNISLSPQYKYEQNQSPVLTGYQASNQVNIRFRDIAKSGAILDTLVRVGANDISGPNLTIDKPEPGLDEARVAAIATARARAELYAKAAGLRVDRILSIAEGGAMPPPMPVMRMAAARAEIGDSLQVLPGEQKLRVSVSVRFLLK